jgi:lipoprotein-anchoring transpeptidase ErfK/SrfK
MKRKSFLFSMLILLLLIPTVSQAQSNNVPLPSQYSKYAQFIVIDKSMNKLSFYEKGKIVQTLSVATGAMPSYTPEGLFYLKEKIKNRPYYTQHIKGGDPRNPLGDRWLGFPAKMKNGQTSYVYAIHGNNNESSIGKHVSLGCIRMHNQEIRWLYDRVKVNSTIMIQK